jgi:hypothetical protein
MTTIYRETLKKTTKLIVSMAIEITFRALMEVLGKPKEHVKESLEKYISQLKSSDKYTILNEEYAEVEKREDSDLWATFVELELKTNSMEDLIMFCFEYMPSSIEILQPAEFKLADQDVSHLLSNLQGRLHQIDMVAKQLKLENDILKKNASSLVKNNLLILLAKGSMNSENLSKYTGVAKDKLEDFLDKLIDDGKIELKDGVYSLKK